MVTHDEQPADDALSAKNGAAPGAAFEAAPVRKRSPQNEAAPVRKRSPQNGAAPVRKRSPAPHGIFIALGSNLGERATNLRAALSALTARGDIAAHACSSFHETAPVGGPPGQPAFLNAAAELTTDLPPTKLLARLLEIEHQFGRLRIVRNGPRTLDLDLLLYHDTVLATPELTLPHPRMWEREFVLAPLREICDPPRLQAFAALPRPLPMETA